LSGEFQSVKPSRLAKEQDKSESSNGETKPVIEDLTLSAEFEQTLRRLVNAVFDLQKDISKINEQVGNVESNIERLRDQFQEFAEKTQQQLGMMIPASQFNTPEETKTAAIEADIKSLQKEIMSVEQLCNHLEQRYESGTIPKETYSEQIEKLNARANSLTKKIEKKQKELEQLKTQG
jgi:chromosome segregation ATPase